MSYYSGEMNEEIQDALYHLNNALPSEEEMNRVTGTIRTVEDALKKLPIADSRQPTYISTTSHSSLLGWHITKRRIYYKDEEVSARPLMECKYFVRRQMIQFLPILIEKMAALI